MKREVQRYSFKGDWKTQDSQMNEHTHLIFECSTVKVPRVSRSSPVRLGLLQVLVGGTCRFLLLVVLQWFQDGKPTT